jgi:hypothetical protein
MGSFREYNTGLARERGGDVGIAFLRGLQERIAQDLDKFRIDPEDCAEVYDERERERDAAEVERLKLIFTTPKPGQPQRLEGAVEEQRKILGKLLECILMNNTLVMRWYGPGVRVQGASEYDDFKNGIDIVLEFGSDDEQGPVRALGLDVTYSQDSFLGKLQKIKTSIDTGELSQIKYFVSGFGEEPQTGGLEHTPRLVVGVSPESMTRVAQLWSGKNADSAKDALLQADVLQAIVLEEMRVQLVTFANYARSIGRDVAAEIFESRLQVVVVLQRQNNRKFPRGEADVAIGEDRYMQELGNLLGRFNNLATQHRRPAGSEHKKIAA